MKNKKRLSGIAAAALFLFFGGCGNVMVPDIPLRVSETEAADVSPAPDSPGGSSADGVVHVTGVSLDYTVIALAVGGAAQGLQVRVNPPNAEDPSVFWYSDNPLVATVDSDGVVIPQSPGDTYITARTEDGGKNAHCLVYVSASGITNVTNFKAVPGSGTIALTWINPAGVNFERVEISSDPAAGSLSVPKVIAKTDSPNNSYTVTGLINGTTYTIKIKAHYTSDSSGETAITVTPGTMVSATDLTTLIGAPVAGETPDTTVTTTHAEFGKVGRAWKKADNSVHSGAFQAGEVYKAELTLTAKPAFTFNGVTGFSYTGIPAPNISHQIGADSKIAVVTITFPATAGTVPVTGVSLDYTVINLTVGGLPQQLHATVSPPSATDKSVFWASQNSGVATVNSGTGVVTPYSQGTTVITAITADGGKSASCFVTVSPAGTANVTNFKAVPGNTEIALSWINPADSDFDYVTISSTPAAGSLSVPQTVSGVPGAPGSYTVTPLVNGTTYTIKIQAHYSDNSQSGEISANVTPAISVSDTDLTTFITTPVTGENPASVSYPSLYNEFTSVMRVWKRADNSTHTGAFQAGQAYKAELTLTAKPTYTFNGVSGFSYTGIPASDISHSISADYKTAVVTINFPATAGVTVSGTITSGDFPGGLNGATVQLQNGGVDYLAPVTTAYDGTYTISGVPAGTYTVVVSKAGYSSYTSPSSFTVNTGNITMSVVTLNLQVTAPARDLTTLIDSPVPAVSPDTIPDVSFAGGQYTVAASPALAWRTVANGTFTTFEPETQYKVTFTLAAASGWSFSGLSSPNFSYAGASFVDVTIPTSGATAEVTITFPMVQWVDVNADSHGTDLVSKLNWLKTDGVPGRNYTITVNGTETIAPQTLSVATSSKLANTGITITGTGTIKLDSNGSLFAIRGFDNTKRITLVLAGNIKLQGKTGNNSPLVSVTECAALVIKDSVEITGNKVSGTSGGGVYVSSSSFTMSGGTISNNTVSGSSGGGVYVALPSSSFTMSGGTISNNEASGTGGGVYVLSATSFAMSGGTISDNEASGGGGGVYISSYVSSVTISGGIISDNTVSGSGGGIYVSSPSFTMSGGTISNNTASSGGGVYTSSSFTMSAGTISNNTASSGGGVNAFSVTMSAGTISGNTAASGGGVYSSSITKTGTAVIYGDTDSTHTPDTTENTATGGNGHAVLLSDGRKRNGDALAGQNLNSGQPGSAGGWEE